MRAWHRGYRVHYEPRATFTHLESATQLHVPRLLRAGRKSSSHRPAQSLQRPETPRLPYNSIGFRSRLDRMRERTSPTSLRATLQRRALWSTDRSIATGPRQKRRGTRS
jgi:hypothetical protein